MNETHWHSSQQTHHAEAAHPSPQRRLQQLLWQERGDLYVLLVYTVITGLFALAVPLAAQALVNIIAAGIFLQPLVVLTLLVFGGMLIAGVLRLLQLSLVETLQQRIFARVALQLAHHLPRIRYPALSNEYAPELVNRFFDVLTVQKSLAKLLLDGLSVILQALVGMVLLAFYSPLLLAFDLFILLFIAFVLGVLGIGGLRTSIRESQRKYQVADWLEDLARCQTSFKMNSAARFLLERADVVIVNWVKARRSHFRVVYRQAIGSYFLQAFASAGTLGIGGWLVINGQLTLGQLVAAELIIVSLLAALEKLMSQVEDVYKLLTGLDKIGHVTDLPLEREAGKMLPPPGTGGASVVCRSVRFSYRPGTEILAGLNLKLEPGHRVSLVGVSGAGKSTLVSLLCGLDEPSHGVIEINGVEVRVANLASLRRTVSLVSDTSEIFDGTVEENIVLGRSHVSHEDLRWALDLAQLTDELAQLPEGNRTMLVSGGRNLSHGQMQRMLIARALVDRPQLLILDEAFTGIDEKTKLKIIDDVYDDRNEWTILDISHDAEVVMRSETVHVLSHGRIVESAPPEDLALREKSEFQTLFPYLSDQILKTRLAR